VQTFGIGLLKTKSHHASNLPNCEGSVNSVFTGNVTAIGTAVVPVSLYATGLISKDSKMKGTALLTGEAVADSEILTLCCEILTLC
jgi:hypothetical protein